MSRVVFDISNLKGEKARILIEDRATGTMGHINVDDIWLTNNAPVPSARDRDPVFGVADLHAHLMNEKSYASYGSGGTPEARALWGSANGPLSNLRQCNDTHTTNDNNYTSFQDEVWGTTYTLCRDMCLNLIDGAGLHEHPGDQLVQDGVLGGYHDTHGGYPNFVAWPMWWSATHQQMHWEWVKRAHQGGLRLMVAAVGNSEVIAFALAKEEDRPFTSDQDAIAQQIPAIRQFATQNRTWVEIARTPRDARRIINSGKLAIVIGVELDHVFDSCSADVTTPRHHTAAREAEPNVWIGANHLDVTVSSAIVGVAEFLLKASIHVMRVRETHPEHCTPAQIEARLDALYHAGVRQLLPLHFSDNLFGGYALTDPLFTAAAIFENPGAHPPQVMGQTDLERNFGDRARRFTPVAREAYYGENAKRRADWEKTLPVRKKLGELSIPIWLTLGAGSIMDGTLLPPGPARAIMQFFSGQCIEDDGWRIFAAVITGGASEAACGISTLTAEALDAARSTMPYEGAIDSPAMIPINVPNAWADPVFHVNARGLQSEGEVLIQQMMRRGMLIDLQHSSEMTKRGILALTQAYPVMVSHGGVQDGAGREHENVLSADHLRTVYSPPGGFTAGIVGVGTQSASGVMASVRVIAGSTPQKRAVALGTDLNGMDWHSPPRFGRFGFYPLSPEERRSLQTAHKIGPMVRYDAYDAATNPYSRTLPTCSGESLCPSWQTSPAGEALHPLQVTDRGAVTRTFDINYDGLAHYGMIPDFLQELSVIGTPAEDMGVLFRSAEGTISMWEESCWQAYSMASRPSRLAEGCGPEALYR
jgi:microsomal dipeptidase-like Zn-dependent dipeptidase